MQKLVKVRATLTTKPAWMGKWVQEGAEYMVPEQHAGASYFVVVDDTPKQKDRLSGKKDRPKAAGKPDTEGLELKDNKETKDEEVKENGES